MPGWIAAGAAAALGAVGWVAVRASVRGRVTVDLGVGRSVRPLGPITVRIAAPRDVVFDAAAAPYRPRPPRELREQVEVLQRSEDMVVAAHRTSVGEDVAVTVEGVVLERPERIGFRLYRGPVPHVVETFTFTEVDGGTELVYSGELGTDLWALGRAWGNVVARQWEHAVRRSLGEIRRAAEGRARATVAREERGPGEPDPSR